MVQNTHTLGPSTATGIYKICQICAAYFTFIEISLGQFIINELYFNGDLVKGDYRTLTHSMLKYWYQAHLQIFEPKHV